MRYFWAVLIMVMAAILAYQEIMKPSPSSSASGQAQQAAQAPQAVPSQSPSLAPGAAPLGPDGLPIPAGAPGAYGGAPGIPGGSLSPGALGAPAAFVPPPPLLTPAEERKIIRSTMDPDPKVRWEAIRFLVNSNNPNANPIIFKHLRIDQDAAFRVKLVDLLASMPTPERVQRIELALQDTSGKVRIEALKALDSVNDYGAAKKITKLLTDQEDEVRQRALTTLNDLQTKRQAEILMEQQRQAQLEKMRREAAEPAPERLLHKIEKDMKQ